jgi:hypothetical protein
MGMRNFLISVMVFVPILLIGQIKKEFVGICIFENFTNTSGEQHRGDLLNFVDRYNQGISVKNILPGDEIMDGSGDLYEVITIHSTPSNFEADITVESRVAGKPSPAGTGQVHRPTDQGIIPVGSVEDQGLSNVSKGLIDMNNVLRLDSLLREIENGDSITLMDYANDSLFITMESGLVHAVRLGIDSLHEYQESRIDSLKGNEIDTLIGGEHVVISNVDGVYTIDLGDIGPMTDDQTAGEVWYNDSYLPLNVNDVQEAIDSLKRKFDEAPPGGGGTDDQTALEVPYDNSSSGLAATEVQTAIDLLENEIDAVSSGASDGVLTAVSLDVANNELDYTVASPGSNFSGSLIGIENLSGFNGWDTDESDDFSGNYVDLNFTGTTGMSDGVDNVDDADNDPANEIQGITWNNGTRELTLSDGGGSVTIIDEVDDADSDASNELQTLSWSAGVGGNDQITLSDGGGTITITDNTGTDDQDASEVPYDNSSSGLAASDVQIAIDLLEDEIDAVSSGAADGVATGGTLDVANEEIDVVVASPGSNFSIDLGLLPTLSGFSGWDMNEADDFTGNYVDLIFAGTTGLSDGVDDVDDADSDPTNELQTIFKVGSTVTLSNGGGSFTDAVNDADASIANELQVFSWTPGTNGNDEITLSLGGGTVTITDNVDDADNDPANEIQGITWNDGTRELTLSDGGGTVTITGGGRDAGNAMTLSGNEMDLGGIMDADIDINDGSNAFNFSLTDINVFESIADTNVLNSNTILMGDVNGISGIDIWMPNTFNDFRGSTNLRLYADASVFLSSGSSFLTVDGNNSLVSLNGVCTIDLFGHVRVGNTNGTGDFGEIAVNQLDTTLMISDGTQWLPANRVVGGGGTLTQEQVQDFVGPMLPNGSHSDGFSFNYDDPNGEIDLTVDTDEINVGFVPNNYSRTTGVNYPNTVDLGAHLDGIDREFDTVTPNTPLTTTNGSFFAGNEPQAFQKINMAGLSTVTVTVIGAVPGGAYVALFQNADDSDTVVWPADFRYEDGSTIPNTILSDGRRMVQFIYDGTFFYVPGGY